MIGKIFQKICLLAWLMVLNIMAEASNKEILLPIEVLGADQTTETRTFSITSSSEAKWLYLRVNNFSVDGKVEVSFNNSDSWTALANNNVDIPEPDKGFGGIGGGYSTIRLYFDIASEILLDGSNTVHFRFNAANDQISVGYRVIDFNILDENKADLIESSSFVDDDPATWTAPFADVASNDEGENLWRTAVLTTPVLGSIKATCSDCHAQDGRDMKYFNYSNKSIVERSIYHGLTEEEGEKIATYIRNLDVPAPAQARPWNPPYQPGSGLDSKPVEEWAAGAGLDAVLESDADMMEHLFPNGTSDEELKKVLDLKGTLNIREIPVALQFPDWKHWLPRTHPKDMMSEASYEEVLTGVGRGSLRQAGTYGYKKVREDLETNGLASYNNSREQLMIKMRDIGSGVQDFLIKDPTRDSGLFWWTTLESYGISKNTSGFPTERYKENLAQWNAVKHWEIMQEFAVEGTLPKDEPYAERMQWPFNNWTVFAIAPHIVGDIRGQSRFQDQDQEDGYYFSTAWYQLQMVLSGGMRNPFRVSPVDWTYNFDHVLKSGIYTGHLEPLRLFQNFIKCYQQRDNEVNDNGNNLVNVSAWNMREVSPWHLYSTAAGDETLHEELDNYDDGLRAKLTGHLLRMFNEKAKNLNKNNWPRTALGANSAWHELESENHIPKVNGTAGCLFPNSGGGCSDIQNAIEADAIYTVIPLFQEIGVECDQVEDLRVWAADMWPLGDWDRFIQGACTGIYLQDVNLLVQANESIQHTIVGDDQITMSELDLRDGLNMYVTASSEVASVVFDLNHGEHKFTDNEYPFALFGDGNDYTDWAINPGTYILNIKAYEELDGAGDILDEDEYSFTVVKGSYLKGISLIQQSTNQLITNLNSDEEYSVDDFPKVLLNIRARTDAENHVGSMTFDLDNGSRVFTDNFAPFKLYGDGSEFSSWIPELGLHTLIVKVYGDADGSGDLIDEATYTYTFTETPITGFDHKDKALSLYPNPASARLTLNRKVSWKIFSIQGQELKRGATEEIDVVSLDPGMYLLQVSGEILRFIKR